MFGCGLYCCKGVGVLHVDECVGVIFDDYLLHVVGMEYLYRYYSYPIDTAYNKYTLHVNHTVNKHHDRVGGLLEIGGVRLTGLNLCSSLTRLDGSSNGWRVMILIGWVGN